MIAGTFRKYLIYGNVKKHAINGNVTKYLRSYTGNSYLGNKNESFNDKLLSEIFKDDKKENLPPISKNNYVEHDDVKNMGPGVAADEMKANAIMMSSHVNPITDFAHLNVDPKLVESLQSRFARPTPIQMFSWPPTLAGSDLVGLSVTGSGKTLSFGVPIMHTIMKNKNSDLSSKTLAVVLLPSWELAKQVYGELSAIGAHVGLSGSIFVGGEQCKTQLQRYYRHRDFVVATPGRLIDLLMRGVVDLSHACCLVLDEADRMMDMGFEPQIKAILRHVRPDRQLTMWSATWPTKVSDIAIEQRVKFIGADEKIHNLTQTLNSKEFKDKRAIVFVNTIYTADFVDNKLRSKSIDSAALHGKKERFERVKIYDGFKRGETKVLVATDVASRGLDVSDIELVVVYDIPNDFESYIHRIGRTGRNKKGVSLAYFTRNDRHHANNMIQAMNSSNQQVPEELSKLADLLEK